MNYSIEQLTFHHETVEQKPISKARPSKNDRAIIVHIFYLEVWHEIVHYLKQLDSKYDLYLTLPKEMEEVHIIKIFQEFPDAHIYSVENRGRDVLPFLQVLSLIDTTQYKYLCKLHTKKSVEIDNGDAWRKLLYYDLIGSNGISKNILKQFETDDTLGMVTGKNLILSGIRFDLGNQAMLQKLASLSNVTFHPDYHFAAGTMFWVRTSVLTPLLGLIKNHPLHFEDELGQTDRTMAHALERFFGLLCTHANLGIDESTSDYSKLSKETLNQLAMLAFTQRFNNDREIQYRDTLIQQRDKEIQKRDKEIQKRDVKLDKIYQSKSYKFAFIFRKTPFIMHTLLHFNIKKINSPDSNEFRFTQAIKRRIPNKVISLLKRIRSRVKKRTQDYVPWHQALTKTSQNKGKSVLIIAELSIPQCTKYRVEQKVEMLKNLGYNVWIVSWTDFQEARNLLQLSALVFFYRVPAYPLVVSLIKEAKRLDVPSFFDVDDLIFDKELMAKNTNLQNLPKKIQKELLKGADLYQEALALTSHSSTSTQVLGTEMKRYNLGENYLIPNCLDKELLTYIQEDNVIQTDTKSIKIVYGSGTSTHDIDFLEVADALIYILNTYSHVKFIVHGTLTLPPGFDALASQVTQIPFMPTHEYYTHLQSYDINLATLEMTLFNDAKSNIKYLEASLFKLPTVASNVEEYRSIIEEGENGFIASDKQSWIDALEKLIHSQSLRKTIGNNASLTVLENYQIEHIAQKYMLPILQKYLYQKDKNTKHILMANVLYNPISFGGATIVIEELSRRISKKDAYDVTVFTGFFDAHYDLPRPYDLVRYEVNDVPVILVRFPTPMSKELEDKNEEMQEVFDKILTALQPDLVHFHSIQQLSASIAKPCVAHKIPYVITLHDMWWLCEKQFMVKPDNTYCYQKEIDTDYCITQCTYNEERTKERTAYLRPILDNATLLLTPSAFQAQMYGYNGLDTKKIKVNKNAIIFPSTSYKKSQSDKVRFAYLGGNAVHKGYTFLKEVFESIDSPSYELILIDLHIKLGHNSIIASDWDIKGTLTLSDGYEYSQKGLDDFFSNVDVLLFPSQWKESFGLTIREALVRDVWVISTDAGGVIEDIIEMENGNIVPIGDSLGFKTHINESISNASKLQNYSNPHKDVIRAYDAQVEELLGYYADAWSMS